MSSHKIFTTAPFHPDDVPLGSLVPDVRYPNQDALIVHKVVPTDKFSKRQQDNISGSLEGDKQRSLTLQLTKLLHLSASKSQSENLSLKAEKGWIYELRQPKIYFKEICSTGAVRLWLREGLEEQQDSYFVVGLRTFKKASVGKGQKIAKQLGVSGTVPVDQAIQANTGVSLDGAADVNANIDISEQKDEKEAFDTIEELVYAIEYRKILMKKREPNAPAALDKDNVWRYYSDNRVASGNGEEGPYEEYEVSLDDDNIFIGNRLKSVEDMDGEVLMVLGEKA